MAKVNEIVKCAVCGTEFAASGHRSKYCSECARKRRAEQSREYGRKWRATLRKAKYAGRKCRRCGEPLPPKMHGSRKRCATCAYEVRHESTATSRDGPDRNARAYTPFIPDYGVFKCKGCRKEHVKRAYHQVRCRACQHEHHLEIQKKRMRLRYAAAKARNEAAADSNN